MQRREFLGTSLAGSAYFGASDTTRGQQGPTAVTADAEVFIEQPASGRPHKGKVLASIAPHSDDHSLLCGGTLAKLIREGYTGYLIRTSNDEKDSYDMTLGETVLANETDNQHMSQILGFKQVFDLNYRNHRMDDDSRVEMRARLIFLIRLLKIDTIFSYDPWGHYEENPDHYVTASVVESACWMAGRHLDFPEHFAAGLKPHSVAEKYYYARGPQQVNRVVNISTTIEQKLEAVRANKTMVGTMVRRLREELAAKNLKLPELEGDEPSAIRAFADMAFRESARQKGAEYGLEYAEKFHYIGPDERLNDYLAANAVPLS